MNSTPQPAKEKAPTRRTVRQAVYGGLVLALFVCAGWYLTSDHFREVIRHRLIVQLEQATGGQVEIGAVQWNLSRLHIGVVGLTIHGLEPSGEAPLVHVNHMEADLRILSLLERRISFHDLSFDSPAINLLIYPDGRTNQPTPRVQYVSTSGGLSSLFDVAIRRLTVRDGLLKINEQRTPVNLLATDVDAQVAYSRSPEFYGGHISVGKFDTHWSDYRPFASAAAMDFRLYRTSLEIASAELTSEGSQLTFRGKVTDFTRPRIEGDYTTKLDVRQAGAISRVPELQAGTVRLSGHATYSTTEMKSEGKLQLVDGSWNSEGLHAAGVSAEGTYLIDRDRLVVNRITGKALGGSLSGDFVLMDWNAAPRESYDGTSTKKATGHTIGSREQHGLLKLQLSDLQMEKIASLFAKRNLPLSDLHAAAVANGTAELAWSGSPKDAELKLDMRALPAKTPAQGQIPVTARFVGSYSIPTASMQVEQAEVQTPNSHLTATGELGARTVDLELGLTTENIQEVQPLITAQLGNELPVQLGGEGSFQGNIEGTLRTPTIAGHLRIADFTTVYQPNSTPATQSQLVRALHKKSKPVVVEQAGRPVRLHWDSFDGYVSYGPSSASVRGGVLRSGTARFEVAGNTTLQNGHFTDQSEFHSSARIRDARVQDALALLGLDYPVTGTLNLELQMDGTEVHPRGIGRLTVHNGTAFGQPLQSMTTDLTFSGREAQVNNLRAISDNANAEGSGTIDVSTEEFRFDLRGTGVDLLRFPVLQTAKVKLTGVADVTAKGSGTLSHPAFAGQIHVAKISLGGKREGDFYVDVTTQRDELVLDAHSQFVTATVSGSGRVKMDRELTGELSLKFGKVDLQPFLQGIARGHSSINGNLQVSGPLRYPERLNARLEIPRYESVVEGKTLRNPDPLVATYSNGTISLVAFRLQGEGTDFTSSGTAQLTGEQRVNMRADGRVNMTLLQSFDPELVAYGQTSIAVRVGGTIHDPALRGRITIEHAGVSYVDLPNGLSDLNGSMVFNEDRLQVEKLTAHTGGGDLVIGGFIAYGRNLSFNLTATGKDVRIRYPEGVSANADATLRLAGSLQNATLSGDVVINKFGLNPRFDFAYYLTRAKQVPTAPNPESPLNNLHFDVRVVSTPELQVQTSLAKITGNVDLHLRGSALRPVVLGRISIVEGDVTFNGTKYRLDRGDILFSNPAKIEPVLDLEASARVSDYDISIGLHGTTDKLNTTYRSDPPLPTADVFALLAFGRTSDVSYTAPQSNAYTETASSAVLGSALNAAVSSRVQKIFGASRIKIDPEVGGAENNPNARITVEQQVSGNITLTYITNLAQSAQQVIQFQYNVNRNVSIVGVRDEYGVVGFEVQIRQRKR